MYKKIMVPVDLAHADRLDKAIATASDLSRHYDIPLLFVGVTTETPNEVAHNPKEYAEKLETFGKSQSDKLGVAVTTKSYTSHDLTIDLDETLYKASEENGVDLIVMASHVPGFSELIFNSNAGEVASHASISVFVVR